MRQWLHVAAAIAKFAKAAHTVHTQTHTLAWYPQRRTCAGVARRKLRNCTQKGRNRTKKKCDSLASYLQHTKELLTRAVKMKAGKSAAPAMRRKPTRRCRRWRMSAIICLVEEALRLDPKHCCNNGSSALSFVAWQTIEW